MNSDSSTSVGPPPGWLPRLSGSLMRLLTWFHDAPGRPRIETGRQPPWRQVLPVAVLGLAVAATIVGLRTGMPDGLDPVRPFVVGHYFDTEEALRERGVALPERLSRYGYDGQWFLAQAHDPLLRSDLPSTFDAPRYRTIRMLMPTLGWLLAAGQVAAIPFALLALEILAMALGCAACARLMAAHGRSRWWGLAFAAVPGVLVGVGYGSAEPLALALAALGLSLTLDRRYLWAGLAFAGAGLTKETYLGFAATAGVYLVIRSLVRGEPWLRAAAAVTLPGVATLAAWWVYVTRIIPPDVGLEATRVFTKPFLGWLHALADVVRGDYVPDYRPIGMVGGGAVMIGTFVLLLTSLALALWLRQSLLAYTVLLWSSFGLFIEGILLGRFLSAQRALAPVVLAAGLFVITVRLAKRRAPEPETAIASR